MALSDLIARLEQEAQSQVQEIERRTEADVRAHDAATDQAIADLMARHLEHDRAARRVEQQRELAVARREARGRELEARRARLARIVERARALLPDAAASRAYAAVLPSHLDEALSFLRGLQPRVRCRADFAPILRPTLARHDGAALVVDDSMGPGVLAEAADGSVVVDNTLAARLARAEPYLAIALSRKLGDGDR